MKNLKRSAARFRDLVREGPDAVGVVSKPVEIAAETVCLLGLLLNVVAGGSLALFSKSRRQKSHDRTRISLETPGK